MSIFGKSGVYYGKISIELTSVFIMLQVACHLPFIYYIAKEHLLQVIDEYNKASLSKMVDRIKGVNGETGDPRFFLVQRLFRLKDVDDQGTSKDDKCKKDKLQSARNNSLVDAISELYSNYAISDSKGTRLLSSHMLTTKQASTLRSRGNKSKGSVTREWRFEGGSDENESVDNSLRMQQSISDESSGSLRDTNRKSKTTMLST